MKKKVIIISIAIFTIVFVGIVQIFNKNEQQEKVEENKVNEEIKIKEEIMEDHDAPVLKLKINDYQVFPKNTKVDYKNLIEIAKDKEDGNLINSVTWNEIDNTLVNVEQSIVYSVKDKAGNEATTTLVVLFTDTELSSKTFETIEK